MSHIGYRHRIQRRYSANELYQRLQDHIEHEKQEQERLHSLPPLTDAQIMMTADEYQELAKAVAKVDCIRDVYKRLRES